MPVNLASPVVFEPAKAASRFKVAHCDLSNRPEGNVLEVWYNAINPVTEQRPDPADETGEATVPVEVEHIVKNCGPEQFEGESLLALAADGYARAGAYVKAGVEPGAAALNGQRDAIYAALQARGCFGPR